MARNPGIRTDGTGRPGVTTQALADALSRAEYEGHPELVQIALAGVRNSENQTTLATAITDVLDA